MAPPAVFSFFFRPSSHLATGLTCLAVVLDGGALARQVLPAVEPQLLVLQLHLSQVLLDVDGGLLGVAAGRELFGPVVLVQSS